MKIFFSVFLITFFSAVAHSATETIINSGFTFSPALVTISEGDSVLFLLGQIHKVAEVSQATWAANGNTQLAGGFSTPLGGDLVLPAQLTVGTHWYVCQPHASTGMKGRIIVQSSSGIYENKMQLKLNAFPNPVKTVLTLRFGKVEKGNLRVCNAFGVVRQELEINSDACQLDMSRESDGMYFIFMIDESGGILEKQIVKF